MKRPRCSLVPTPLPPPPPTKKAQNRKGMVHSRPTCTIAGKSSEMLWDPHNPKRQEGGRQAPELNLGRANISIRISSNRSNAPMSCSQ